MKRGRRFKLYPTIRRLAIRRYRVYGEKNFRSLIPTLSNGERMKYWWDVDTFNWSNTPEGYSFWANIAPTDIVRKVGRIKNKGLKNKRLMRRLKTLRNEKNRKR